LLTRIAAEHKAIVNTIANRTVAEVRQGKASFRFLSSAEDRIATQAALAWEADLVLLAVDATQGVLPVHREHVLVTRQMGVPMLVIAFTKSRAIDDPQLLELEELETRELLKTYDFPGETTLTVFDDPSAKTTADSKRSKGPVRIVQSLEAIAKKRSEAESVVADRQFRASLYSLVPQEAFTPEVAIPVRSGATSALIGNESVAAKVIAPREIAPGENGEIEIVFAKLIRVAKGQRFLLLNRGHIAATGFFLTNDSGNH
jgi:translation elongation factor EF-Tu-like GTPase